MGPGGRNRWPRGAVAAITFLVAVIVLVVLLRPAADQVAPGDLVAGGEVRAFEAAVARDLPAAVIRPAHSLRIRAARVAWADEAGETWLRAPAVAFSIRVGAAPGTPVIIEDGVIDRPELRLVQRGPDRWNFDHPLEAVRANDRPATPTGARADIRLRNMVVRNGTVTVATLDASYRATGLQADLASAVLAGAGAAGPSFHLRTATATLSLPDTADGVITRPVAIHDARFTFPDGALAFDVARASFGASVAVDFRGVLDRGLGGLGLDAVGTVQRLELADLPWLRTEVPEDAVASFDFRVQPLPGDRSAIAVTGLDLRSETSAATGSLRALYGPAGFALESIDARVDPLALSLIAAFAGPLPYVGDLRGTIRGTGGDIRFELAARLATAPLAEPFAVDLEGRVAVTEPGLALRHLTATFQTVPLAALQPVAPGLPFRGPVSGTVRLDGPPGDVPIQLDVRLEAGGGVITVAGTLDLRGAVPAYDLRGRLVGVELRQVLEPAAPPARVNATFTLAGRGTDLETAHASLRADGGFTGWHAAAGDTLSVRVDLTGGLIRAEQVRLALGPIALTAAGDWRFANGAGGAIRYTLGVDSLEPLAPFLPTAPGRPQAFARGALTAEGTLSGTLEAPALAGRVSAVDFRYDDWAATRFRGTYDVRLGPGIPHLVANLDGRDVRTPAGDFDTATMALELVDPTFTATIHGVRARGEGVILVEADGRIEETGLREVFLRRVELDLEGHRWRLPGPARIAWIEGDIVQVSDLRLVRLDGEGVVRLHGIIAPFDLTDFEVEVAAFPTGDLAPLLLPGLALDGTLWLAGTVRGPTASPALDLTVELREGAIQEVDVTHLQARATYRDGAFFLEGDGIIGDSALVAFEGSLPLTMALGLPPSFELDGDGPVSVRLRTEDFPLASLDPAIRAIRDLEGRASADILLTGTPAEPRLGGAITLSGGAVVVPILNQRYRGIEGTAVLDGQELGVERLVVMSDGPAVITGTVRLEDLTNPGLALRVDLERFRAQGVSGRRDAAVTGRINLGGTVLRPAIGGAIAVDDGTVDLRILDRPPRFDSQLIGIGERFDPLFPADFDLDEPGDRGVRITGLDITAGPDLWFQTDEVRAQLSGDLSITMPDQDPVILGTLAGQRGTFNLRIGPATRRFNIVDASLRFFGTTDRDPAIDITATRIIPGPNRTDFELRVRVTGTLAGPAVAFAAEDGTAIPEAEALNFLIFGRATATLADFPAGGGQGFFDALAFYGLFDAASDFLAQQVGAGIDYFQIQVRSGIAEAPPEVYFVLGQEVIQDVFLLVTVPTTEFEARWALATEWRIDRQWTLEAGYEPPEVVLGIGGLGGRALPFSPDRDQQLFVSIRRRWSY